MSEFLEYLIGSRFKSRMIKTLVLNPKIEFSATEIAKRIKFSPHLVSQELKKMALAGLVIQRQKKRRNYYYLNKGYIFYAELKSIVAKCNLTPESKILSGIKSSGRIVYAVLCGIFTENRKSVIDLLVVGDNLKKSKIKKVVSDIEADIGREIRYCILNTEELFYRLEMFDKFISDVMEDRSNIVLVNRIDEKRKKWRQKK